MRWQNVALLFIGILSLGTLTYVDLFSGLFQLTGMNYTHSGDSVCDSLECVAYINVTTTYWRICFDYYDGTKYENETILFKKWSPAYGYRSRTLHVDLDKVGTVISTEPKIEMEWFVPTRGRGNWRPLKGGDCWNRLRVNKIKLVGHPEEATRIKWDFNLGDKVAIDPVFISWNVKYENLSKQVSIYDNRIVIIKPIYFAKNNSWTKSHNYTNKTIIGYKTEYYNGKRIGVKVGNKEYGHDTNVVGDKLIEWSVPIGDRNFKEYGRCRAYEKAKGVCTETKII